MREKNKPDGKNNPPKPLIEVDPDEGRLGVGPAEIKLSDDGLSVDISGETLEIGPRDLRYMWFFPIYLIAYLIVERVNIGAEYHLIHCYLDDLIPFNEFFVIPYLSWHVLIFVVAIYALRHDAQVFRKLMQFFIIGTVLSFAIFIIYPSYQDLRPESFEHDNIFTWIISFIYWFDTPTNVTPSMHVIGSIGLLFAVWDMREETSITLQSVMVAAVIFICASTLLIKQHSVIDVVVALPVSFLAWVFSANEFSPELNERVRNTFRRGGVLTIPNALTFIRLMLIPVIIRLYFDGEYTSAIIVIALSGITDVADGWIARHFNMVSDFGKALDPVADKLTQAALIICLTTRYRWMWALLLIMAVKELCQIVMGYLMLNKYDRVYSSQWFGKICTASVYITIPVLIFFPDIPDRIANALIIVCGVLMIFALMMYARFHFKIFWGERYSENVGKIIRSLAISLWVFAVILAIAYHDKITVDAILKYTPQNLWLAALVMLALFALKTMSVFFYSGVLFTVNGLLFNFPVALLMNVLGALVMVVEGYYIGRAFGSSSAEELSAKHPKFARVLGMQSEKPFLFVFLVRMFKVINYDIGSMYMGATRTKMPQYIIASILGMLPEIIIYAAIGNGINASF